MSGPQVGDVITTAEDYEALPIQTVILDASGDAGQRLGDGWHFPETIPLPSVRAAKYGPATILYLPGQPPRPERVVKAEALREYRSALLDARLNPGSQVTRELEFLADLLAERADRIERGEL